MSGNNVIKSSPSLSTSSVAEILLVLLLSLALALGPLEGRLDPVNGDNNNNNNNNNSGVHIITYHSTSDHNRTEHII